MVPLISIKNVTKRFGDLTAVKDISLDIFDGGILSIIGPNGAGKTTFFKLLTGFLKPDSGHIYLKGENITNLPPYEIVKRGLSLSFQIPSLYDDMTVQDNVSVGIQSFRGYKSNLFSPFKDNRDIHQEALKILQRVRLIEIKNQIVRNISHGDRKLLDIGMSLTADPKLLLLDEPTSGLSGQERDNVVNLIIGDLSKAIKLVIVEHDMDIVFNISEQILVLNRGAVLALGTPNEISRNPEVQGSYLGGDSRDVGA